MIPGMAAPERKDGPGFPVAIVATVLVALAGIIVGQLQLVGTRPPASEIGGYPPGSLQDVPGRLWQDPFAAIDQYLKRAKDSPPNVDPDLQRTGAQRVLDLRQRLDQQRAVTEILGVLIFGGDYPENAEQRRRTRYAVVSALSSQGFVPEREDALGYFKPPVGLRRQTRVPFEWFRLESSPRQVLLLWLDENVLEEHTAVGQLVQLMGSLGVSTPSDRARVAILGPVSSGTLASMVAEMGQPNREPPALTFFSTATATTTTAPKLDSLPPSVLRMIATDDKVMGALVEELQRRNVDVTQTTRRDRIVLLSEWDTLYGRELPRAFEGAVCASRAKACQNLPAGSDGRPPWILHFSYLRGLDGQIPGEPRFEQKPNGEKTQPDTARPADPLERAEGHSQFDYVRRLALRVQEFAPGGRNGESGARIAAIGVLGSDVYDKSLVLQAFRKEFPKAVFFTTDLDARLLHPAEYNWTRNLVVASGFGLALHRHLQRDIPPFRDSYQTAAFFATQRALVDAGRAHDHRLSQRAVDLMIPPRVFEVARGQAFDLSGESPAGVHPHVPPIIPSPNPRPLLVWTGIALAGLFLLYLASPQLKDAGDRLARDVWVASRQKKAAAAIAVLLGVTLVIAAGVAVLREGQQGEPFLLSSGISLWPTEVIRLVAAVLSACFLVAVRRTFKRVQARLETEFDQVLVGEQTKPSSQSGLRKVWAALRDKGLSQELTTGERHKFTVLWGGYLEQASFGNQCRRVGPAAFVFLVFCSLIMSLDYPQTPARGNAAWWIDQATLWLCVLLLACLILVVSDTIRLIEKYTGLLGHWEPTEWPPEISNKASDWLGIPLAPEAARERTPLEKIQNRCVSHWLDIKVIEMWTEVVSPVIYCPFIVLCLMILARSPLFDNWGTPYTLMVVFGLSGLYAAACAFKLRRVAERARSRALERFAYLLVKVKGDGGSPPLANQIEIMVNEVQSLRRGAFAPFTEQPVVRALLLPISSAGGLTLIHFLGWREW